MCASESRARRVARRVNARFCIGGLVGVSWHFQWVLCTFLTFPSILPVMIVMNEAYPIARKLEEGLVLCVDRILGCRDGLMPAEMSIARSMTPRRRQEFRAGRSVARRALTTLGKEPGPILCGSHGEPIWPGAIVGSVTHTHQLAGAAVCRKDVNRAVGIDLNDRRALGSASDDLMTAPDIEAAGEVAGNEDLDALRNLVFSAKEALYKCQFPLTLTNIEHLDVELSACSGKDFLCARTRTTDLGSAVISMVRIFPMKIHGVMGALAILSHTAQDCV